MVYFFEALAADSGGGGVGNYGERSLQNKTWAAEVDLQAALPCPSEEISPKTFFLSPSFQPNVSGSQTTFF
ncbi:MAG: hypothetical protein RLZZ399_2635 [Verrucomicrobiota bacterium]|jgi:hypothetical protein